MKNGKQLVSVIVPTFNRSEDVMLCIRSIMDSTYPYLEIIVVDNASTDNTQRKIMAFDKDRRLRVVLSPTNLGAGGGRNRGAEEANGKYLLFVDSDNVIDRKMISELIHFFEENDDCGIVGPLMLIKSHPDRIWTYFADINMYSSRAFYKGYGEKNHKQYSEKTLTGHIPNCFMVKKADFEKVGGFDEKYFIMYEEADLAERIKRHLKKKIYFFTKAITYHNVEFTEVSDPAIFRSPERAFLTARNRVYFMKKNAGLFRLIIFSVFFNSFIMLYYLLLLARKSRWTDAGAYLRGNIAGYFERWK